MSTADVLHDPVRAIQSLSSEDIVRRLYELDQQAAALRVLLRSARARESRQRKDSQGGPPRAA
jgi:hypothetical protein